MALIKTNNSITEPDETVTRPSHASLRNLQIEMEEATTAVDPAVGDVTESIAYGLLNDAEKLGQVRL